MYKSLVFGDELWVVNVKNNEGAKRFQVSPSSLWTECMYIIRTCFILYVAHVSAVLDSLVERALVEGLVAEALLLMLMLMWVLLAQDLLLMLMLMLMWVLLVFLLAEDLQLQEELLLLQETCIRRVHLRRRRLLCLLVRRDVLVVLQLLYFRLDVFGFLVAVLLRYFGLQRNWADIRFMWVL